jgi:phage tail tube protein FII
MANTLYVMEGANIFCGSFDPSASNHLGLQEIKLPNLEENYVDHVPGGGQVGIRVDTHINPLEATFNLAGWTPQVQGLIRRWGAGSQHFYAYGALRDRKTGKLLRAYAEIWGRLGRANPSNFRRGDLMNHEYTINGIMHYELFMDTRMLFKWDFFESTLIVDNVDVSREVNTVLNIGGGGLAPGGSDTGGSAAP